MFHARYGIVMYFRIYLLIRKLYFACVQVCSSWTIRISSNCNPPDDGLIRHETF